MKKFILLFILAIPLFVYGQKVETDSISRRYRFAKPRDAYKSNLFEKPESSGILLQKASAKITNGLFLVMGGSVVTTATLLAVNNADDETKTLITLAGCAIGGVTALIGTIKIFQGSMEIGKAGRRLEYELGAMESKLAFKF